MTHYIAIVEEENGKASGVWFPDLPGCFSAGDDLDRALVNAQEALALYAASLERDGRAMPRARTLTELKSDPEVAPDLRKFMVALVPFDGAARRPAAE